ncbi:DoxX family protein [Nostoc linckia z18]|uniref:DoxX family protein n=2 Tax=Nostoc linckia TaxID=92942 RepID=A0A9Q5ZDC4_NOSLI|nr:DoxX family protein [Nostoc linckia]PHK31765.1 DoxX family protein [Nostoc linckia z15]PHK44666.1 DoxX family protein [Nostoc linckia z16]PHJ63507.1 DoxX family protein [Nostoc linckia z1]PHJ68483.1 DoxX family protein [Nostoc linckia z3]PHJ74253.1 DoxX family protein [Nostoc linckia z2]
MIYQFVLGMAIAMWVLPKVITFILVSVNYSFLGPYLLSSLTHAYPSGIPGLALLLLRVSVGGLFLLHGYPKVKHLRRWAESINTPVFLCFISAWTMLGGGFFLILGFLTLLATLPILASMLFAILLHLIEGKPFVATDPYLIPGDQYKGPLGKSEPPSWEKAFMYCVMLIAIAVFGPGAYSLDALIFGG